MAKTGVFHFSRRCQVGTLDHVFEWNWPHHWFVNRMLFDLDGVLSADWPHTSEEADLAGT